MGSVPPEADALLRTAPGHLPGFKVCYLMVWVGKGLDKISSRIFVTLRYRVERYSGINTRLRTRLGKGVREKEMTEGK